MEEIKMEKNQVAEAQTERISDDLHILTFPNKEKMFVRISKFKSSEKFISYKFFKEDYYIITNSKGSTFFNTHDLKSCGGYFEDYEHLEKDYYVLILNDGSKKVYCFNEDKLKENSEKINNFSSYQKIGKDLYLLTNSKGDKHLFSVRCGHSGIILETVIKNYRTLGEDLYLLTEPEEGKRFFKNDGEFSSESQKYLSPSFKSYRKIKEDLYLLSHFDGKKSVFRASDFEQSGAIFLNNFKKLEDDLYVATEPEGGKRFFYLLNFTFNEKSISDYEAIGNKNYIFFQSDGRKEFTGRCGGNYYTIINLIKSYQHLKDGIYCLTALNREKIFFDTSMENGQNSGWFDCYFKINEDIYLTFSPKGNEFLCTYSQLETSGAFTTCEDLFDGIYLLTNSEIKNKILRMSDFKSSPWVRIFNIEKNGERIFYTSNSDTRKEVNFDD